MADPSQPRFEDACASSKVEEALDSPAVRGVNSTSTTTHGPDNAAPRYSTTSPVDLVRFESAAPRTLGAKEDFIRAELGISPIRYYQKLNQAIDDPDAMEQFPHLTARLRRLRDGRTGQASGDDGGPR